MVQDHEILGTAGASRRLGVSERRTQQLADLGVLRALRTDRGARLFLAAEVDVLAAQRDAERAARAAKAQR